MSGKTASLTPSEMDVIRSRWETDKRTGFTWLVSELSLPFTPQYLNRFAKKRGWKKAEGFDTTVKALSDLQAPMRNKMVEDAIFRSAMGLHEVKEPIIVAGRVVTITKRLPPSVEAQIYLLSRASAAASE